MPSPSIRHDQWPARTAPLGELIQCFDPATREPLGEVPVDSPEVVREKVARARLAQPALQERSFRERGKLLSRVLSHVLEHADELCEIVVRDSGKTLENAMLGEVWPVCEKLRWTIANGEKHLRDEPMSAGVFLHKKARVEYAPKGVVGVICPWNYPLQNVLGPAIPALFAGNGVVIKVSEQVAWSAARFQRIFDEALEAEGLSTDLVQLVNGYGETGAALVSSGVGLIVFTGSGPNGRRVIAESAKTLTPVIVELGGKDPMIVCEDAVLEQAAHAAMAGCFIAAGQNCMAAERILVTEGVYDAFVARVLELTGDLRQGSPLGEETVDVGAIVSPMQVDVIERLVNDALDKGARALTGGKRGQPELGQYFEPTLLVDVTPDMAITREEVFGPVMAVMKVRDEDEAIHIANDSEFGLGSTVLTRSKRRARRIAQKLSTGSVSVNDFCLPYMAQALPFGGVRASGFGRLNGREGLRACTNPKSILEDRFPLHIPAKLYPVAEADYDLTRGAIRALYQPTLSKKLRGAVELTRVLGRKLRRGHR